tara:strand:+ start:57032 stop:57478 length:447 start_codon:yes stop_codon:yes gene_type:complete
MKITKTRLKEIIREELSNVQESDWHSDEHETLADKKYADSMATTEPQFTGGSPEERMNLLLTAREKLAALDDASLAQLADTLDAETLEALEKLMANPMYAPSGMEEAADTKVSKKRSEKTLPDSKKGANKAYNKADRSKANRDLKKQR